MARARGRGSGILYNRIPRCRNRNMA